MQKEFSELEIDCIPGALFYGTAEFNADEEAYCERIILHGAGRYPELVLSRASTGMKGKVFSELQEALLLRFADDVGEIIPGFDPEREYGTYRKGAL